MEGIRNQFRIFILVLCYHFVIFFNKHIFVGLFGSPITNVSYSHSSASIAVLVVGWFSNEFRLVKFSHMIIFLLLFNSLSTILTGDHVVLRIFFVAFVCLKVGLELFLSCMTPEHSRAGLTLVRMNAPLFDRGYRIFQEFAFRLYSYGWNRRGDLDSFSQSLFGLCRWFKSNSCVIVVLVLSVIDHLICLLGRVFLRICG